MDIATTSMELCREEDSAGPNNPIIAIPAQQQHPLRLPPTEKVAIAVEVCLKPTSAARHEDVRLAVERMLEKRSLSYVHGPIPVSEVDDQFLLENIQTICICETDNQSTRVDGQTDDNKVLLFWQVVLNVHVYQLNEEGPGEEIDDSEGISSFQEWVLPAKEFHGLWDSLIYDTCLKQRLLRYAETALLFAEKGVDPHIISWNRVILLHGPPGTGKTSLCRALAQKLSIRFSSRFPQSQLVEVNAHSLFSKWFSESGKLVTRLFQKIQEFVEDENTLVFVLIDEVESLAAARQAALSGSEPSDSIRVVNALLTQLDRLKSWPNVMVLTTSNITGAIDLAFVDRADIKAYVGPPTLNARYEILRSCINELSRVGILTDLMEGEKMTRYMSYASIQHCLNSPLTTSEESDVCLHISKSLLATAEASDGLSGRALRKLPFLAHALMPNKCPGDLSKFLLLLENAAKTELSEQQL